MSSPYPSSPSYSVNGVNRLVDREINHIEVSSSFESFSAESDFLEMESHPVSVVETAIAITTGPSSKIPSGISLAQATNGKHQASP